MFGALKTTWSLNGELSGQNRKLNYSGDAMMQLSSHEISFDFKDDWIRYITHQLSDKILSSLSGKNHEIKREKGERIKGRSLE